MVTRIALTGGPCAGKSTVLKRIRQKYEEKGYAVYLLPEAATLFIEAGADFLTKDAELSYVTEKSKLEFQLQMERSMTQIAEASGKPALLICDRGTMDTAAYMPAAVWQRIKDDIGLTEKELRDEHYDAVLHICTAAKGAEDFYTLYNNKCRSESVEVARDVDDRILAVWKGHPVLHIIKAEICFEDKIQHVLKVLDEIL
jgi:predicted ATPase